MFLNLLQERNKEAFLALTVHASLANGIFAEEEKDMIYAYCHEMNMKEQIPSELKDFEQIIDLLADQADDVEKKIIIMEILGLIKADGIYDEQEKRFMEKLTEGLKVDKEVLGKFDSLLEIYLVICKELRAAVCE